MVFLYISLLSFSSPLPYPAPHLQQISSLGDRSYGGLFARAKFQFLAPLYFNRKRLIKKQHVALGTKYC